VSGEATSGDVEAAKQFLEYLQIELGWGGGGGPSYVKIDLHKQLQNALLT
jgi:hypothetical protein